MARIAIAGFQHETNTFAPTLATYHEFERHDGWPGLTRGAGIIDAVAGIAMPLYGFITAARDNHDLLPMVFCSAEPSSFVTRDAFERITAMLCDDLVAQDPFDAVYLGLHGAMVVEHYQDGEGEILRRVREVVGNDIPVVASLDLHANVTEAMVEHASTLSIYRTYPHIDMESTAARAYALLDRILAGERFAKAFRKAPFLVPLTAQCTDFEPNRSLYQRVVEMEGSAAAGIDLALGFPPADILECGLGVVAYDSDQGRADSAADNLFVALLEAEAAFDNPMVAADEAVARAMANGSGGPVVLADAQDNPGAGASSDTVGLMDALVRGGAQGAVLAILDDAEIAAKAHEVGIGASFDGELGGKSGMPGQSPYNGRFRVDALGDGCFTCYGEMYRGTTTNLGSMALLRIEDGASDVCVIVGSSRFQCLDQAIFRHLGVEPTEQKILAVKSSVHFRADFDPIASETIAVEEPGSHPCRLEGLDYKNLRDGVRLGALGPVFTRSA
ncbi:MAG: M81 family metallopeptidase [Alphaproteobacteria bacterium]